MAARCSLLSTRRLAGTVLAGLLLAGVAVAVETPPARAADGATGLHNGMMPAGSPDAVTTGAGAMAGGSVTAESTLPTGVDVSHWQHDRGPVTWSQVAASGQKFAIMKATELYTNSSGQPTLFTDPYLHSDLAAAHGAGLVVGAYAFAHPENSPIAQADAFATAIGTLPSGSLPPVLDLEVNGGLTPGQLIAWTHSFLDRLQDDTNIVPMIYSGPSFWSTSMGGSTDFIRYPLWEAHYTTAAAPYAMGGWSTYTLWQFTSTASVPGITGNVDQNRFNNSSVASLTSVAQVVNPSTMAAPGSLGAGQRMESPNQQYELVMQGDGNLVVYGNGRALWSTRTAGRNGAALNLQPDGNLVLYSPDGVARWASGTNGNGPGGVFSVGDDGALRLRFAGQSQWTNGAPGSDSISIGTILKPGQYLHSPVSTSILTMQTDGNLVLYRYGRPLWASDTQRHPGARLVFQSDGNLVVYDTTGRARWDSGTVRRGGTRLVMQADGNLVLYGARGAVWATRTNS